MAKRVPQYTLDIHEAHIHGFSHDERGIALINEKITFLEGGLPGEKVRFQYRKQHSRFDEGQVIEVLQAAPERVAPICAHFSVCGGCSTQHIAPTAQIHFKQATLLEQLKHFGHLEPAEILAPITGPTAGYRRKARLGVKYVAKKNKVLVGFRERNGRYLADLSACPVLDPQIGQLIEPLSHLIHSLSVYDQIAQIEVAIAAQMPVLVFRNLSALTVSDIDTLKAFGAAHNLQLYLQPHSTHLELIWPEAAHAHPLTYHLMDQNLELGFGPLDFMQVNADINQKMINRALEALELHADDKVLDLFCGLGNFSLALAQHCAHVVGVEGSDAMVERATENARLNTIQNAEFYKADLNQDCRHLPWFKKAYDKILLDPARSGALEIIQQLNLQAIKKIVYVSCNPATLARDAGILVNEKGFQLKKAGVIDMFPHTSHVEALAVFEK